MEKMTKEFARQWIERGMKERLKAAVEELTAILQEMQVEFKEYERKKSAWYYNQLKQHYSGLSNDEEFQKDVFDKFLSLHSHFYVDDITSMIECIEKRLKFFEQENGRLDKVIAEAKNKVPAGWKSYKVKYTEEGWEDEFFCYAPSAEKAVEFCKQVKVIHNVSSVNEAEEVKL